MNDAMQMTDAELTFAARDLAETIAVQEQMNRDGLSTPKLSAYWDELFAVQGELNRRRAGKVAA